MATLTTELRVSPVSPRLGAEIAGVDLTGPVDHATAEALRQAFGDHKVLVFRDQHLSPDQHVEAVRIFDQPFDHPTAAHRNRDNHLVLPFLLAHAGSPDYAVSFGWRPGDFVLWDNLATWHRAVNDYDGPRAYRKVIAAQLAESASGTVPA